MIRPFLKSFLLIVLCAFSSAFADEASIKKAVESALPGAKVDEVRKLPYSGLYEVRMGQDLVYTDEKVSYFLAGELIDAKTRQNLTSVRQAELSKINFSDLPLDVAVKNVRGKGTRVIATFEDPNCGYCKQFAKELTKVDDVTIYTFLLPILSADSSNKADAIWCSADRGKAWTDLMVNNKAPASAAAKCTAPSAKVKELAQKYGINGTPTIFFSNGLRVPGYMPAAKLEEMLKTAAAK